ncbi:unnamed protein product [Rotaria socialis]|uniref:N-acetyltransferase domain-containing protein n=2 Tax=Rotaria socialis TaxID=392032 RepID=A0A818F198_9BILA|nr:unnamed protein product [Rotaria socialis]CAF4522016.1 unnamed protein product [Rotaria socialis]
MTLNRDVDTSSVVYRSIKKHEQKQVLDLLYSIFPCNPADFERSYTAEASPDYQEGDTLGAWHNGILVSTAHIRRLRIQSSEDDNEYLCGFISNVATAQEYRKRGFSRHLLRLLIEKMEQSSEFDLSMLGTDVHNHYSALGWEQISIPMIVTIEWNDLNSIDNNNIKWCSAAEVLSTDRDLLFKIHSNTSRKYQYSRTNGTMFTHWAGWDWQHNEAIVHICHDAEPGYVVISKPNNIDDICVYEWRAPNIDVERKVLKAAAEKILQRHQTNIIRFHGLPQYIGIDELNQWAANSIKIEKKGDMMIRNIRLSNDKLENIKAAYSDGSASCWLADFF